jgi:hypothetical protein
MSRTHVVAVALMLALAAAVGLFGLARTLGVGASASASSVPDAAIARRAHALDRFEASLQRQLAKRPPALPSVPAVRRPAAAPAPSAAPVVRYVRPAPVVVSSPRSHRDDEGEHEALSEGGEGDD